MLTPVSNNVLFTFVEEVSNGTFINKSEGNIYLGKSVTDTVKEPRWGVVIAAGPDVCDEGIVKGAKVLIEPMMWTKGFDYDGVEIWSTNETKIMAIAE